MRTFIAIAALVVAGLDGTAPHGVTAAQAAKPSIDELWQDRDIASLDLKWGNGGPQSAPSPEVTYQFKDIDESGYSTGYEVVDPNGRQWKVKTGREAQSEVVASRVLWAVGYHQPVMHFMIRWKMKGGPMETPPSGRFRLSSDHKSGETWSWDKNPFRGTREFKGLLVANLILNNWDLKTTNNRVYKVKGEPAPRFVVQDTGASLGKSQMPVGHRNNIAGFESQRLVLGVETGHVKFDYHGRHQELLVDITPADVVWLSERMNRISDQQWDEVFVAAAYPKDQADRFIRKIKSKVQEGLALGSPMTSSK